MTDIEGQHFQEWLQQHGPFDAVIDGANICLTNMHNFNFLQVSVKLFTPIAHYTTST